MLYQEPYIEANHAYLSVPDGINKADLPNDVKLILQEMINRNLGVFASPYLHQIESLEIIIVEKIYSYPQEQVQVRQSVLCGLWLQSW